MKAQRVETPKGVCVVNVVSGGEHTLCGDAFDLASDEEGYEWKPTRSLTVTCDHCVRIIESLRGIHTK